MDVYLFKHPPSRYAKNCVQILCASLSGFLSDSVARYILELHAGQVRYEFLIEETLKLDQFNKDVAVPERCT